MKWERYSCVHVSLSRFHLLSLRIFSELNSMFDTVVHFLIVQRRCLVSFNDIHEVIYEPELVTRGKVILELKTSSVSGGIYFFD